MQDASPWVAHTRKSSTAGMDVRREQSVDSAAALAPPGEPWQHFCFKKTSVSSIIHNLCGRLNCNAVDVAAQTCGVARVQLSNAMHVAFERAANECAETPDQVICVSLPKLNTMSDDRVLDVSPVTQAMIDGLRTPTIGSDAGFSGRSIAYLSEWRRVRQSKRAVTYDATLTTLCRSTFACVNPARGATHSSWVVVQTPDCDHMTSFWAQVEQNVVGEMNRGLAAARIADARFLPHQTRNAVRCVAKELLGLSAYRMVCHSVFVHAGSGDLSPSAFVDIDGLRQSVLVSRRQFGAAKHTAIDKTFTFILDGVGTGKTRSALGAVLLGGARGENPFGLRPAHVPVPWAGVRVLPDTRSNSAPFGAYAQTSRNLARIPEAGTCRSGGTLIVVQHNMIDHWLSEIRDLWPEPLRVGVLGAGELSRARVISPSDMAEKYDLVLASSTLLSKSWTLDRASSSQIELVDELWPVEADGKLCDDGTCYSFLGTIASARVTVFASSAYMANHFDARGRRLCVQAPQDLMSPHLRIYAGSLCDADIVHILNGSFAQLSSQPVLMARMAGQHVRWRWTVCVRAGAVEQAPLVRPIDAILRIGWHRLIVDELHLFNSTSTKKRQFLDAVCYQSFIGLTAQRELRFTSGMFLFERLLGEAVGHRSQNHHADTYTLNAQLFVHNSLHDDGIVACAPPQVNAPMMTDMSRCAQDACAQAVQQVRAAVAQMPHLASNLVMFMCLAHALKDIMRRASVHSSPIGVHAYAQRIQAHVDRAAELPPQHVAADPLARQAAIRLGPRINEHLRVASEAVYTNEGGELCCPVCFDTCGASESLADRTWIVAAPCMHTLCRACFQSAPDLATLARCVTCRGAVREFGIVTRPEQTPSGGSESSACAQGARGGGADADADEICDPSTDKRQTLASLVEAISGMAPTADEPEIERSRGVVVFCECSDEQIRSIQAYVEREVAHLPRRIRVFGIAAGTTTGRQLDEARALSRLRDVLPVVIVRYRMCAVGINLTFADHCIIYNMPHRHDYLHQAIGRLCRIGQPAARVNVWPVLYENSFEALIWTQWNQSIHRTQAALPPLSHIAARFLIRHRADA